MPSDCLSCNTGYFLQDKFCGTTCNGSTYKKTPEKICDNCDLSCKTCDGPTSSNCLTCFDCKIIKNN